MPPWLNGLQRSRRQPARIEPRIGPELADRLDRVVRSRSGSSGSEGRAPARSSAGRAGSGRSAAAVEQPFHDKRSSAESAEQLRQRGADAVLALALEQSLRRPGGRRSRSRARAGAASASSQNASRTARFTLLRVTALPILRPTERPRRAPSLRLVLATGEGVEDQEPVAARVALAVDAVEVAAPGEPAPAGIRAALRGQRSRGEALAALLTPAPQDGATGAGAAARPETVRPGSLALLRLIGPLHQESPGREGRGQRQYRAWPLR